MRARQPKPWIKTDNELFVVKQATMKTASKMKQMYKVRVVQWGKHQPVLEKRLYVFNAQQMDYFPGRLMALNIQDMKAIYQNKEKIDKIMNEMYEKGRFAQFYERQKAYREKKAKEKQEQQNNKKQQNNKGEQ